MSSTFYIGIGPLKVKGGPRDYVVRLPRPSSSSLGLSMRCGLAVGLAPLR